jgi:FG-GAP repeat
VRSTLVVAATLTVGDFDGDGFADLVAGSGAIYRGSMAGLVYLRHDTLPSQVSLASGDVNGDGCDDIVWQLGAVTLGSPTAVLAAGSVWLPSQPVVLAVEVADLDGDGREDVVALQGGAVPEFGQLQWNRWRTATGPTSPQVLIPQTRRGVLADLDGDGDADFLAGDGQRYENLASYGGSCGAPMTLASGPVVPGSPWQLTIDGAPASTLAAILFGTADQVAACGTLVAPTSLLGTPPLLITGTTGSATQIVEVPVWFTGGPFFLQAIALDPTGGYQRFGVSLSSSGGRAISIF